ncbi:PQQ-dependent dehydrogenase, methanol/ethanol family [Kineobactrum salinum]|uniref:PQQ-dependent dehydrogenase, methanol/ethanol family n=1 Tax=Kineobactrum salinum TaxID=2708301 RepID=UPI001E4FCC47|nr:PQQ-dependent dehydrogenase, methanol/ethanol family [Kineobactrum salinum]
MTGERIVQADREPENWLSHGRTYAEDRFSPLKQINTGNAGRLRLAWYHDLDTARGQEATPIVVDGRLYTTSAWSKVQAFDAATGELLWQFDPEVPGETAVKACCDVVNRGAAVWQDKIYVGTLDGRLIALDSSNGEKLWSTLTVDRDKPYTITGAPRVVKGKVLIGNGGGEFGVRGYVSAYDADSGELAWRFYTVPGDPSKPLENPIHREAAKTWSGEWWRHGGGGTVWDSMSYDPELDLLYIGVGNGSPWNPDVRSPGGGDNLFLSSIVALRPDTGEYVWHYQTTPGDRWDYTATQQMILATLEIEGEPRKVLMQAPKNGFFYVLDRATGELLSAEPFVPVNWASGVDLDTGRPAINPDAYYNKSGKPWLAMPGALGAHNWHSMAFHPGTGLVYLPAQEMGFAYINDPAFRMSELAINLGIDLAAASLPQDPAVKKEILDSMGGHLLAWDPVKQSEVWRFQHPGPWNGGVLATAGDLVFQGNAAGIFAAYHATTGEQLWSFPTQTGVVAAPVSYTVEGTQYITVVAGWGGIFPLLTGEIAHISGVSGNRSRVLTFALDGEASLPALASEASEHREPPARPEQFASAGTVDEGKRIYHRYCIGCHGDAAVSGGILPDLRWSALLGSDDAWWTVVGKGALRDQGMVGFASVLKPEDAEAVRAYVIKRAHETD